MMGLFLFEILTFSKCAIYGRCQYRYYTASIIGWLQNTEHLVEWELAGEI
jgi:hypothetical protein